MHGLEAAPKDQENDSNGSAELLGETCSRNSLTDDAGLTVHQHIQSTPFDSQIDSLLSGLEYAFGVVHAKYWHAIVIQQEVAEGAVLSAALGHGSNAALAQSIGPQVKGLQGPVVAQQGCHHVARLKTGSTHQACALLWSAKSLYIWPCREVEQTVGVVLMYR